MSQESQVHQEAPSSSLVSRCTTNAASSRFDQPKPQQAYHRNANTLTGSAPRTKGGTDASSASILNIVKLLDFTTRSPPRGPDQQYELEARFGERRPDGFCAGVPRCHFDYCYQSIQSYPEWSIVEDWRESHEFYYKLQDGREVRTITEFQNDESQTIHVRHMEKKRIANVDLCIEPENKSDFGTTVLPGARVSLSLETAIPESILPDIVRPTFVRIKKRKSFLLTPSEYHHGPVWTYDLTQVWEGRNKAEAEHRQINLPPRLEFEIECRDLANYVASRGTMYTAKSIFCKTRDFFPDKTLTLWESQEQRS